MYLRSLASAQIILQLTSIFKVKVSLNIIRLHIVKNWQTPFFHSWIKIVIKLLTSKYFVFNLQEASTKLNVSIYFACLSYDINYSASNSVASQMQNLVIEWKSKFWCRSSRDY